MQTLYGEVIEMKLDPKTFDSFYRVLTGVVVPRPIAFVSTVSSEGVPNLAPYSFFNVVASDPPTIVFSSSRHTGLKRKDTLANIEETGEFVVNVVVDDIAEAMNMTAAEFPEDVDEFEISGLTPIASDLVKAPRVSESPVNMECRLNQIIPLGNDGHANGLVIGEIVLMHVRDDLIDGHRINHQLLKPTGRLAGSMYCHTSDVYEMPRPIYNSEDSSA
ncbi:MAG: flavin reductase family protein [Chloroflexota bacterium]|nr:flavin reductase family protein [Chloroflexota bacterium]